MKAETLFGIGDAHGIEIVHRFAVARLQEGVVEEDFRLKRLSIFALIERLSGGMPGCRVDDLIGNADGTFAIFGFVATDSGHGQDGDNIEGGDESFHDKNIVCYDNNVQKYKKSF